MKSNLFNFRTARTNVKTAALVLLGATLGLNAQNLAIRWSTIDGGGGTSTGGVYAVSGTIGQPDAGIMRGGNFAVNGGFWGYLAPVQMPGAPLLNISLTPTNTALIWWTSPSTGFNLQQNTNGLGTLNWSNVTVAPTDNGTIKSIVVSPSPGHRFYRLVKPQ